MYVSSEHTGAAEVRSHRPDSLPPDSLPPDSHRPGSDRPDIDRPALRAVAPAHQRSRLDATGRDGGHAGTPGYADLADLPGGRLGAGWDEDEGLLGWQQQALCAQTDPDAFFPEKGGSTREAKRICISCDVKSECLEYALGQDERFGIWGGLSERERRRLKREAS